MPVRTRRAKTLFYGGFSGFAPVERVFAVAFCRRGKRGRAKRERQGRSSGSVDGLEHYIESGALTGRTAYANPAAMGHNDFAGDGEAEAGAGLGLARHAEKAVEDACLIFGGDAGALVGNGEPDVVVVGAASAEMNLATGRRVLDGIIDEVRKDVGNARAIHRDRREVGIRCTSNFQSASRDLIGGIFDHGAQEIGGRDLFAVQFGIAFLEAGKVEEIVEDAQEPLSIITSGLEQFLLPGRESAESFFEEDMHDHAHAGQRGF